MGKNKLKKIIIEHESLPIVYNALTRRLFVKSSMGLLAIPLIASLLPRESWASVEEENAYRKAVFMANQDGSNFLDAIPRNVNYQQVAAGVKAGSLNNAELGPIYNGSFNNLKSKFSILTGLTCAAAVNHCKSAALAASFSGFIRTKDGHDINGLRSDFPYSIDVVLANHIYGSGHPQNLKVLRMGTARSYNGSSATSNGWTNYGAVSTISTAAARSLVLGSKSSSTNTTTPPSSGGNNEPTEAEKNNNKKRMVLERVLASISSTKSNANISVGAKSKIDNYQQLLAQIRDAIPTGEENNGGGTVVTPAPSTRTCGEFNVSSDSQKARADIIAAALACGATRLATMSMNSNHSMAHAGDSVTGRDTQKDFLRNNSLPVGAYLMGLMDQVTEANGNTLLENSCVLMTSDNGSSATSPHNGHSMRVLVGGGLNGKLRMGEAIDYSKTGTEFLLNGERSKCSQGSRGSTGIEQVRYGQRPYNELLITIMRSFGLRQSDYSFGGRKGFGQYHIDEVAYKHLFEKKLVRPSKPTALANRIQVYMKNFLKGYNRDTTLSYYLKS